MSGTSSRSRWPNGRLAFRLATACAIVASSIAVLNGTGASAGSQDPATARQQAFSAAAAEFGVPESVLLGVSYLQSRWDTNAGTPSTTAGYGPMHLTDAAPFLAAGNQHYDDEDPRGDDSRPMGPVPHDPTSDVPERLETAKLAAQLAGTDLGAVKADPVQNIRGGAALLAHYQGSPSSNPADWYQAVARYGGSDQFADEVFAQIRQGASRVTDDGQRVELPALDVRPAGAASTESHQDPNVECPRSLRCEWIPAPYQQLPNGSYGHYDLSDRPERQKIRYIVIHDTEGTWETTLRLIRDPAYAASWQYTLRSADGHIAQHINSKDVAWQAGNWYVNAQSIGLEHEGFAALGTWYTEAMYRSSAKLVRYLAARFDIPLNRHHIIGHDQVAGITPARVPQMHWDPGPYWNWNHYFALLGAPFHPTGWPGSGMVTMKPNWETNKPAFYGCDSANPSALCPSRSSSSVILRQAPSHDAPLVVDVGLRPDGSPSTMRVSDIGGRASAGTQWAVAEIRGDWTAIWYLGQKAWFHNPRSNPAAVWATGLVITPKRGLATIPVYGRAYPEATAYPPEIPYQTITPLQYTLHAGERYVVGQYLPSEYYRAVTYNCSGPGDCTVVRGQLRYFQIQFGHRAMYVNAADVDVLPSFIGAPRG